jgi:L-ribulokinase
MYTIGLDYGTNSVRAIIVNFENGHILSQSVKNYPSGDMGVLLDSQDHNLARQEPADYLLCLENVVIESLASAEESGNFSKQDILGIGVDTTGSSPIPVDSKNIPISFHEPFKTNLNAKCWLWKDHTSHWEAGQIVELAHTHRPHYLGKIGGTYSSEWFWSKIWHCLRTDLEIFNAAHSWVELCDFIPAVLSGISETGNIKRGICAAGHKALYNDEWGGLPDAEFLGLLAPELAELRSRLYDKAYNNDQIAGNLCEEMAQKLGLNPGIPIAIGAFDAHYGAIGAGVKKGTLVKIIGTSTCDVTVVETSKNTADIPGICGIVNGSVLPGFHGIEAGQSAVGDIFNWFIDYVCESDQSLFEEYTQQASTLSPGESGLLSLDWHNGNRTILVDHLLTGMIIGQTLQTTRVEIFRSLIEATAFGARAIIERIEEYGVEIDTIVCCGGIAEKNQFLMQIYADILGKTLKVSKSDQTPALGSAIAAFVCSGKSNGFAEIQNNIVQFKEQEYYHNSENHGIYSKLYGIYMDCHNAFGGIGSNADLGYVMKELLKIKEEIKVNNS